jgi:hypothetical protein
VTGVEECPTTKPGARCRVRRLVAFGTRTLGLALVSAITATVVVSAGAVAADQVSGLQAQAAHIAQDLVLEQLQIGADQQEYDVDGAKVQQDEAEIRSTQNQIQSDTRRVSRDRARLQAEAVSAYVNMDPSDGVLFEGSQSDAFAKAEYEDVTSGDTELTIDALRSDESGLRDERATLSQQEAEDQATADQEATQASAARQAQGELNAKQSEITGQLVAAVAQQQAAQAVAAAKAVRAAQAAAAASAASSPANGAASSTSQTAPAAVSGGGQGATASGTSSGDPALPPFLQCVLRVESGGNYAALSPGGTYMGGFQFSQPTWNAAAQLAGMPQLVNVPPNQATPAEQDDLAIALYQADGQQPWDDSCRGG